MTAVRLPPVIPPARRRTVFRGPGGTIRPPDRAADPAARGLAAPAGGAAAPAPDPVSYRELKALLMDPWVPDERIAPYLTAVAGRSTAFHPVLAPDARLVDMGDVEGAFDAAVALDWGNGIERWRRQQRFNGRVQKSTLPVLVSEGDSWFQFPFLLADVIDQLDAHYLIWSLDAAGDTANNMVVRRPEYMEGLRKQKAHGVQAFLFSAAGNDVIGQTAAGTSVLHGLVKPFQAGRTPAWHVDQARLAAVLKFLRDAYRTVIRTIRSDPDFAELPILVHGYDYVLPGGHPGDPRRPLWAARDKWLGRVMAAKGIPDAQFQADVLRVLIDATYDMLTALAGNSDRTHVHVVDVRGALPRITDWADEIHPTDAGFARVADRFRTSLRAAGVGDAR